MDKQSFDRNYSVYKVELDQVDEDGDKLCAYFVESTAPLNMDEDDCKEFMLLPPKETVEPQNGLQEIVDRLAESDNPSLVISVHGFNCPRDFIFDRYAQSYKAVNEDKHIRNSDTVCIGYRWPSERMFLDPFITGIAAAPGLLITIFIFGCACTIAATSSHYLYDSHHTIIAIIGIFFIAIPLMLITLRLTVYFRDAFRATTFGIPDLVDLIQDIDEKLQDKLGPRLQNKVHLSFIGHSMGAYVVTSAVRILSDVFSPRPDPSVVLRARMLPRRDVATEGYRAPIYSGEIGHAFTLKGLVLVSPDIPSESLVTGRASFLAASLERFEEAFLFSSKDDVVLGLISRVANYFSVPTLDRRFGYRLGNVAIDNVSYGIVKGVDLDELSIGPMTIGEMRKTVRGVHADTDPKELNYRLLQRFSYFDCTDCVDTSHTGFSLPRPLEKLGIGKFLAPVSSYFFRSKLTLPSPFNKIGVVTHFVLLLSYIGGRWPDVHSGYFQSDFLRQLIYRVNCLGWDRTVQAFDGFDNLDRACKEHRIKVRWAPPV